MVLKPLGKVEEYLPEGVQIEYFVMRDGMRIRAGFFPSKGKAVATILLVNGHREFMEKYKEFIEDFQSRGFDIFSYDHRGQGGSDRHLENRVKSHNPDFNAIILDMHEIVERMVKPHRSDIPLYMVAHSMGAQFAMRYLNKYPDEFDRAVLMAPFTNFIADRPVSTYLMKIYAKIANLFGFSEFFAPRQARSMKMIDHEDAFSRLTHDPDRYKWSQTVIDAKPSLFIGGVTFGWINGVMNSIASLHAPGFAKRIKTPIFAFLAEDEQVVDNESNIALLEQMPNAIIKIVKGSRHEIYREVDSIRNEAISDITVYFSQDNVGTDTNKIYKVKLDGKVIGATRFENGDPTRGVVAGVLLEYDEPLNYDFFAKLIKQGGLDHVGHDRVEKFININMKKRVTVHMPSGERLSGKNGVSFVGLGDKNFTISLIGVEFPLYGREFPHHCRDYIKKLENNKQT